MKHFIKQIKFNNFNETISLNSTIIDGNMSFNRTICCSLDYLNQIINKIMLQNRDLDFYKELHCTEVNDDCYYEFNTPNDKPIVFDSVWFKELFEGENWRMIA